MQDKRKIKQIIFVTVSTVLVRVTKQADENRPVYRIVRVSAVGALPVLRHRKAILGQKIGGSVRQYAKTQKTPKTALSHLDLHQNCVSINIK